MAKPATYSAAERPIVELCEKHGITLTSVRTDRNPDTRDPEGCLVRAATTWTITLARKGRTPIVTTYGMGSAHKGDPRIADVLVCLISDAQSGRDCTFEDFCRDFGYDTDSRKAHATWTTCVETNAKIKAFLGTELEVFEVLAAEY